MKFFIVINFLLVITSCSYSNTDKEKTKKYKYFTTELIKSKSPNGKRNLQLGERGSDTTAWITQVLIDFDGCGGDVYSVAGHNLSIKIFWKGDDTIIIETKSEYKAYQKNDWMQCLSERIKIIYVEK